MDRKLNARIQHKIDTQENWEKATNFIPLKGEWIFYDKDANNTNIRLKIGDGETNVNELPFISTAAADNPDGGAASPQIQTDYNQNDDTQIDYIKNRPFYAIPPEISFNFDFYRSKESMVWDGVILPNHPSISIPGSNMIYYKVSNNFITSTDCLNCYMKYSLTPEAMEDSGIPEEMKEYDMYLPCSQEIMTQFTFFENEDMFLNNFALSFNITGNIPLDDLGISLDVPETGTYFLYDTTGEGLAPGYVKAIDGALKIDLTDPDLANDPDLLSVADIYGSGTLLLGKKVSSEFLPTDKILNATFGMNMVNWNIDNIDSNMSAKIIMSENMLSNNTNILLADDNTSYALTMGSTPLFTSISSPLATFSNGLQIPGPGTYFAYNNLGREQGEMELWVNFFESPETVFQIDPKYIPKIKTTEDIESDNKTPVSSQGVYEALGNRSKLYISSSVDQSSNPVSSYAVYQALGYRTSLPEIVNQPSSDSSTSAKLISPYGVYQGLKNINDYLSSSDYYDSNYTSLKYRGSNLRPISQENSYSPDQTGTILWFYE